MIGNSGLAKSGIHIAFGLMCLFAIHSIPSAIAQPTGGYLSTLIKQAKEQKLYQQPLWLALLHYNHNDPSHPFSYAVSNHFFIAKDGRYHPDQELIAMLTSLFNKHSEQESTPCKFPARYQWLKQQLSLDEKKISSHPVCQKYQAWRKQISPASVTLVFPSSYMNAPSSVFGHTLLRIDDIKSDPSHLLSHSISFAAKIPDGTGGFEYAIGGLNGTFPGRYQHALYHQKIKEYGRIENRDIWEYKLNLNQQELNRLLMHLWEIKEINFRYFFAKENCSFRLLELLEVARVGSHLTSHFPLYAIPADTIRILNQQGFISSTHYRPSASTRLYTEINNLSRDEQQVALQISLQEAALTSPNFIKLEDERKSKVIQLAYRYLKWKQIESWQKSDRPLPYHLIQQLKLHPVRTRAIIPAPSRPDRGHASRRIKLSSGYENKTYLQLGLRPLYHDLTDIQPGYGKGSEIIFLNTEFRLQRKSIHLHQLDILKMTSLRSVNNFLQPLSWRMEIGLYRSSFYSGYHLNPRLLGTIGYTYQIMPHATLSILPAIRIFPNPAHNERGYAQFGGSIEYLSQVDWGTTYIQAAYYHALGKKFNDRQIDFRQTFAITNNKDFRIGITCKERCRRNNIDYNIGFGIFF